MDWKDSSAGKSISYTRHTLSYGFCTHVHMCTHLHIFIHATYIHIHYILTYLQRKNRVPERMTRSTLKPRSTRIKSCGSILGIWAPENLSSLFRSTLLSVAYTISPWGQLHFKLKAFFCICPMVLPLPTLSGSLKLWSKIPQSR